MRIAPDIERFRVRVGPMATDETYGCNGFFLIPVAAGSVACGAAERFVIPEGLGFKRVIARWTGEVFQVCISEGLGWDHVSVTVRCSEKETRTPTWDEMCRIKNLFFKDTETVVQFHPRKSEYVNVHPNVLHLWRDQSTEFKLPNRGMV